MKHHYPHWPEYQAVSCPSVIGKAGGVVAYIDSTLTMTKEEVHHLIENNTCMELLLLVNKRLSFAVILIYRHPHGNFISFMESLENILSHKMLFQYSNVIICGDININLFETTNRVKQYKTLIKPFNYDFLLKEPTHKSDSCIVTLFPPFKIGKTSQRRSVIFK